MIIYQATIAEFIKDCESGFDIIPKIKSALKQKLGLSGINGKEEKSWATTLRMASKVFKNLANTNNQYILLEYVVPFTKKRIDLLVVGQDHNEIKTLAIIELKGWSKIERLETHANLLNAFLSYGYVDHPAAEALDYLSILSNQFNDPNNWFNVKAITYLPNYHCNNDDNPLLDKKFTNILKSVDLYYQNNIGRLTEFLKTTFNDCIDIKWVNNLDALDYKPSKSFLAHLRGEFKSIKLFGSQRIAFERFIDAIETVTRANKKSLFIISGCAGSGKTILAFKILAYLLQKAEKVNLILPGPEFRDAIKREFKKNIVSSFITGAINDREFEHLIIDEAHKATSRDNAAIYFKRLLPKINQSLIVLIDDQQVINKKGITKSELKALANKEHMLITELNLEEQFRNAGDASYTNWLKNWIFGEDNCQTEFVNRNYKFHILDHKEFNSKYREMYDQHDVRMLSFWTQTWDLHALTPTVKIGDDEYVWNPNWQWLSKYKANGHPVTPGLISLCENQNFNNTKKGAEFIGYINTVQGSEFEYVFVHIPKLFYLDEENRVRVNIDELYMREMSSQIWSTKNIKDPIERKNKEDKNEIYFLNRLFVNLTRGTGGTYVYIEDLDLRNNVRKLLKNN